MIFGEPEEVDSFIIHTYSGEGYRWETDIPVTLRDIKDASTVFKLTFEFNDAEKAEFKEKFGIALSKSLQMKFQLFETRTEYNIIMPGRAKKLMEEKENAFETKNQGC